MYNVQNGNNSLQLYVYHDGCNGELASLYFFLTCSVCQSCRALLLKLMTKSKHIIIIAAHFQVPPPIPIDLQMKISKIIVLLSTSRVELLKSRNCDGAVLAVY